MENQQERNDYDEKRTIIFYDFIKRFVSNYNRHVNTVTDLHWLSPPRQFWSTKNNTIKHPIQVIEQIIVYEITTFYNNKSLDVVRKNELMRMDINQ